MRLTIRVLATFLVLIASMNAFGTDVELGSLESGRLILDRWIEAVRHLDRTSVRFQTTSYNTSFKSFTVFNGLFVQANQATWAIDLEPVMQSDPVSPPNSNRVWRREQGSTFRIKSILEGDWLCSDAEPGLFIPREPVSALAPANCSQSSENGWQILREWPKAFIDREFCPLLLGTSKLKADYDLVLVKRDGDQTRLLLSHKLRTSDRAKFKHLDAFFRGDSPFPHKVRFIQETHEVHSIIEPPRLGYDAEITESSFQIPEADLMHSQTK